MRIVFMGTPAFAVPVLDALVAAGHEIAGVISQPDREKDKKGNVLPTPVKRYAEEKGLPLWQYDRVSRHVAELCALKPDIMITAAYGQMLSAEVLAVAPHGILNVHASLLPRWRGASPIAASLKAGDTVTGVTIMRTALGMDTGDILCKKQVPVLPEDTTATLTEKLSAEGARLLVQALVQVQNGTAVFTPQDDAQACYCKKIEKSDGLADFTLPARQIAYTVRAYNPWPTVYTHLDGLLFKIYAAQAVEGEYGACGLLTVRGDDMIVACGQGGLRLQEVQIAGKRAMTVREFLRGKKIADGTVLS